MKTIIQELRDSIWDCQCIGAENRDNTEDILFAQEILSKIETLINK